MSTLIDDRAPESWLADDGLAHALTTVRRAALANGVELDERGPTPPTAPAFWKRVEIARGN